MSEQNEQQQQPMLGLPSGQTDLLSGLPEDMQQKLHDDLADVTFDGEDGEAPNTSWGQRIKSFLESGYRGMTSVAMEMITGPTAKAFGGMIVEVGVQEAEARAANILKENFWLLIERTFKDSENKVVKYLFFTPGGRVITITAIAFPLSAVLHMQALRFKEQADEYDDNSSEICAKLCLVLSRVLVRMATQEGVRALDIDNRFRKGLNWVVEMMAKEGVDTKALLASTDKEYSSLDKGKKPSVLFPTQAQGYNAKKKKRR